MSFVAKYPGVCEECGERIEVEQEATFLPDHKSIRHYPECPDPTPSLRQREVCTRCFTEKSVTGACAC